MKIYKFEFFPTGNPPGWNDYNYFSEDLSVYHRQPFIGERSCMEAVVREEGLVEEAVIGIMTDYDIDRLLIENNIYVKFIEGEDI